MIFNDFLVYVPIITIIIFFTLIIPFLNERSQTTRIALSVLIGLVFIRYMEWRFFSTVLPVNYHTVRGKWVWFCFILEFIGWIENCMFHLLLIKKRNNSKQADHLEKALLTLEPKEFPDVDVYIPTYNEDWDILEKTIVGCKSLIWPKNRLHVWVLDDGRRSWLKEKCHDFNINYLIREDNKGAKAGNINAAFSNTTSPFIAIFDADFIPQQNFLTRVMGFFHDPKIAIVQTPQVFYNFDFMQTNLGMFHDILDDQRLFFDVIMPARDGWDSAFFCGSCGILRRKPIMEAGGLSSESITEDILLSLHLLSKGYITRYLNEPLSHGLAAETIEAFTVQRKRWCHGGIQLFFAKKGLFSRGVPFIHRLFFLPLSWIIHPLLRLLTLSIPIVYLLTDTLPMHIGFPVDIISYQMPFFVGSYLLMMWHAPWRWIPVLTTAFENVTAINLLPTIFRSFFDPKSKVFKVTPKGNDAKQKTFHAFSFYTSATFFVLLLYGLTINFMPQYQIVSSTSLMPVAASWGFFSLLITVFMMAMSFERPRYRKEERFNVSVKANILADSKEIPVHITDISVSGAQLSYSHAQEHNLNLQKGDLIDLSLNGLPIIFKARVVEEFFPKIRVTLEHPTDKHRQAMITYLYTTPLIIKKPTKFSV